MDKIYQKRTNILDIIDRLHVEKTIIADSEEKSQADENTLKDVVNPILLDNLKQNVVTVQPGINGKVKRRVYMLRRSRTTEGGSLVCELCGHLSFKLYSTAIEIAEEEKRASQLRRTQTEVVKLCRICYVEHNGGQIGSSKSGRKNKVRPTFDRSPYGSTNGRASNSWHFLRRDVAKAKTKLLIRKECFEDEFMDTYLSEESSEADSIHSSEGEETCYEDSESDEHSSSVLPFQLNCSPKLLEKIEKNELPENPSPVPSMKDGVTLDMLLENELAITRSNSAQLSPVTLTSDTSTTPYSFNLSCNDASKEKLNRDLVSSLLEDHERPMEVVKEEEKENTCSTISSGDFINTLLKDGLFDYFTTVPGRFRKLQIRQKKKICVKKKVTSNLVRQRRYTGVCRLVTVLNQRKGHYIDNSASTCLFDTNGNEWRKQDLPSFIGLNTKKYVHGKPNYRQRKKEVDCFLTTSKPKKVVKYKTIVDAAKDSCSANIEISVPLTSIKNPSVVLPEKEHQAVPSLRPASPVRKEMSTEQKSVIDAPLKSSVVLMVPIEEKLEKKKDEPNSKKKEETRLSNTDSPRGRSNHQCAVCHVALFKSYNVFTKDTTPLTLLKYFTEKATIRVCRSCLSENHGLGKSSPNEKGKKRARPVIDKEPTVPAKVLKPNQQVKSSSTKDAGKNKPNSKSPPKKSESSTKPSKKFEELTKVLHKTQKEEEKKVSIKTNPKQKNVTPEKPTNSKHSKISVNVLRNPGADQLKKITEDQNTKYVIVQSTGKASGGSVQKLSTVLNLDNKCSTSEGGDITINGKRYRIDTEFKLNELLKDNENASLNMDSSKDILAQLPSILKHTIGNRTLSTGKYQIVDSNSCGETLTKGPNVTILPKPPSKSVILKQKTGHKQSEKNNSSTIDVNKGLAQSSRAIAISQQTTNAISKLKNTIPSVATKHSVVTSSLPSISLRIQEQLRTSNASLKMNNCKQQSPTVAMENNVLQAQVPPMPGSNSMTTAACSIKITPTNIKPIQLIQPPKTTSLLKRPMYGSPLNTPMPPKTSQKQNTPPSNASSSNSTIGKTTPREVRVTRVQISNAAKL